MQKNGNEIGFFFVIQQGEFWQDRHLQIGKYVEVKPDEGGVWWKGLQQSEVP